jgi:hypothetical protein
MCSRSVNALLRYSIKRSTLITSSSLEAPLQRAGRTEDVVRVLIASTYDYIGTHAYSYLVLGCFILFICNAHVYAITCIISFMQCLFIRPYAYSTYNPAVYYGYYCCPVFTTATVSPLLLL